MSWSSIITKSKRVVNTNRLVIVYLRELVFCKWSINISFAKVQWTLNFVIGRYSIHFALLVDCSINHVYLGESLPHSRIHEFVERLAIWKPFGIWVNWVLCAWPMLLQPQIISILNDFQISNCPTQKKETYIGIKLYSTPVDINHYF